MGFNSAFKGLNCFVFIICWQIRVHVECMIQSFVSRRVILQEFV